MRPVCFGHALHRGLIALRAATLLALLVGARTAVPIRSDR